jgi:uncharacterized protein (TIGR02757 family)
MKDNELKEFLDFKANQYESSEFIKSDPIQIPHQFSQKEDIEITAFLMATIAWGNRKSIIANGQKLLAIMGNSPYDFVMNYDSKKEISFVHRTFNSEDLDFFFRGLNQIYKNGGLEKAFSVHSDFTELKGRIYNFRTQFLSTEHQSRSQKHVSNPMANSACKRLIMFLRWMVRDSKKGVDFGIWKEMSPSQLLIPMDLHVGRVALKLKLIDTLKADWMQAENLTHSLKQLDPKDPTKYDFALFGLGIFEGLGK